jgi:hypothetical protein
MSVALFPPRPLHLDRLQVPDLAAICRARKIVATLGGRFSLELGIDVDCNPDEIDRWALAATLLGNQISTSIAMRTYRVLESAGIRTIREPGGTNREELASLLDEGGYGRFDEQGTSRLQNLADAVADRYDGRLSILGEEEMDSHELERALTDLPSWDADTARLFLRELRGVWPAADVALDHRAVAAAGHLRLPMESEALASLAAAAHLDFRDLEVGLLRLSSCHTFAGCPGGEECVFAAFDRDQFVHF